MHQCMSMNNLVRLTPLLLGLIFIASCADNTHVGNAIVQGTVTVDGTLAPRGQVTFYPEKQGPVATGPIHSDGSFSLRIGQGNMTRPDESKIYSGNYTAAVIVSEPADKSTSVAEGGPPLAGPRLSATKYTKPETSGLEFSVKPGRNVFAIELEGSKNDPPPDELYRPEESDHSINEPGIEEDHARMDDYESPDSEELQSITKTNQKDDEDTSMEDIEK
ncbi:hypothetical protein [Bythopirellula goksoeyrii]|uniref:Carboxypeptidase regulatory-like domain-containing protein n=1 Tax=Bythopirellula goksoeyrii TaxID=1400387 RepID=A0A5B9QHU5_9BACT|nr:hypothetical protein [Bythopirellula goksoeyrii]QEG36566.1 hypothetical protein Pr1d_38800 [Bythopirellula goksoeyrii]